MKRNEATIVDILKRIEGAEDARLFFEGEAHWPDGSYESSRPGWTDTEAFHVHLMVEAGLIRSVIASGEPWQSGGERDTYLIATGAGHDLLDQKRKNTLTRRIWVVAMKILDRSFSSIIAPIVVSVLTVLAMQYFGLVGAVEP